MNEYADSKQKIAIVTGGASGLGFAIAQKFVHCNIHTIIIGRNRHKLKSAKEELGELCSTVSFDLNDVSRIPGLVQEIAATYGKIDILVNNAGVNLKKPLTEVSDQEFQQVILTNLTAVFSLSREIAKIMLPRENGNIINISSMAAQYGIPQVVAYTAAKSGVEGMTKAMAVELSPHGIRVNCIAPGFIATEMSAQAFNGDPGRKDRVLSRTPLGKLGKPEDIAESVFYLTSDAARYITGAVLPVDGGNSIGF